MVMEIEEEKTITKSENDDNIIKESKIFASLFDKLELLYWMQIDIPHAVILIDWFKSEKFVI